MVPGDTSQDEAHACSDKGVEDTLTEDVPNSRETLCEDTASSTHSETVDQSDVADTEKTLQPSEAGTSAEVPAAPVNNSQKKETRKNTKKATMFCNKCGQGFATRNKLFDHIKVTGHALHIDTPQQTETEERSGKKSKKNKKKGR